MKKASEREGGREGRKACKEEGGRRAGGRPAVTVHAVFTARGYRSTILYLLSTFLTQERLIKSSDT